MNVIKKNSRSIFYDIFEFHFLRAQMLMKSIVIFFADGTRHTPSVLRQVHAPKRIFTT